MYCQSAISCNEISQLETFVNSVKSRSEFVLNEQHKHLYYQGIINMFKSCHKRNIQHDENKRNKYTELHVCKGLL